MEPKIQSEHMRDICTAAPVMPVLVIADLEGVSKLAAALISGGLPALEITLRTDVALEAISTLASTQGAVVGAGTLLSAEDVEAAKKAGARFGVSPGATTRVIDAAIDNELPLMPGAATASEMMALLDRGYRVQKFFPAEASGGANALASFASPLPQISFCPTGGISLSKAPSYLSLPNVICVGGSWIAAPELVKNGDWPGVEARAKEAAGL